MSILIVYAQVIPPQVLLLFGIFLSLFILQIAYIWGIDNIRMVITRVQSVYIQLAPKSVSDIKV